MNQEAKDSAIVVNNVSKDFILPHEKRGSVKSVFTGLFKQKNKGAEVQHALKNVTFEVKEGEFFGIVGRNGSGKSTLLKILAEIYQPTTGSISTTGKLIPFIELGVGFNPELSGRENVYLNGAMFGFSESQIDKMYSDIVEFAELGRFMDQKLKNYSSGMQVRLAFSMATRSKADILLVDEVLAVGDAEFQRKCFDYFKDLKRRKKTVIFVTHDMSAVEEYCDRAMLIEDSEVVAIGAAKDVAQKYLQLFSDNDAEESSDPEEIILRWGDGAAQYMKPVLSNYKSGEALEIKCTLNILEDITRPLLGFSLKNGMGQVLFGTNTDILSKNIKSLNKGQRITVTWNIPDILNDGKYFFCPTINYAGGKTADWWEESMSFRVNKSKAKTTPYYVNPPIKVSLD